MPFFFFFLVKILKVNNSVSLCFFFCPLGIGENATFQLQGSKELGSLKEAVFSGTVLAEKAAGLVGAVPSSLWEVLHTMLSFERRISGIRVCSDLCVLSLLLDEGVTWNKYLLKIPKQNKLSLQLSWGSVHTREGVLEASPLCLIPVLFSVLFCFVFLPDYVCRAFELFWCAGILHVFQRRSKFMWWMEACCPYPCFS